MRKTNKAVLLIVAILVVLTAVFAALNAKNIAQKKAVLQNSSMIVTSGEASQTVTIADLQALSPTVVAANYKSNGKAPIPKQYTGVSLKRILDHLQIDYAQATSVTFTAADGYASALPIADALNEESCFIVYLDDGNPLGTRETGGPGPLMMITAKDPFSQRWCKYLLEVKVQ